MSIKHFHDISVSFFVFLPRIVVCTTDYFDVSSSEIIEKNLYNIMYKFYTDFSLFRQIKRQDTVHVHFECRMGYTNLT
jgi:hypothetical protein